MGELVSYAMPKRCRLNSSRPIVRAIARCAAVAAAVLAVVLSPARAHAQPTVSITGSGDTVWATSPLPDAGGLLRSYANELALRFLPRVRTALGRIGSFERRLLAMKYYLNRSDSVILAKWAWDTEEIAAFRRSAEYGIARAELRLVERSFEQRNPGYDLDVRMEIRTLGEQIGKWNSVRSIGLAARQLYDTCLAYFRLAVAVTDSMQPEVLFQLGDTVVNDDGLQRFIAYLRAFEPRVQPTVAVPGLSQHGRLRAFDFRIHRRGSLVAGTSTASIPARWDAAGWTARLQEAICLVSDRFEGPLTEPYEPWHYEFKLAPRFADARNNPD